MKTTFLLTLVLLTSSVLRADEFDLPVVTTENFNKGATNWEPKDPSAWKVVKQGDNSFYSMFKDSS